jgi:hypothetical protein
MRSEVSASTGPWPNSQPSSRERRVCPFTTARMASGAEVARYRGVGGGGGGRAHPPPRAGGEGCERHRRSGVAGEGEQRADRAGELSHAAAPAAAHGLAQPGQAVGGALSGEAGRDQEGARVAVTIPDGQTVQDAGGRAHDVGELTAPVARDLRLVVRRAPAQRQVAEQVGHAHSLGRGIRVTQGVLSHPHRPPA